MRPWMFWILPLPFYAVSAYALHRMEAAKELVRRTYGLQRQQAMADAQFWIAVGVISQGIGILAFFTSIVLVGVSGLRKRVRTRGFPMD
jgi:hypothetical protein